MLAIYTRLSREIEDSNSIENQLREAKSFAEKQGYKEYEIYNEGEGISGGAELYLRPEFTRLMDDIDRGKIKAVYARKQERLERNLPIWSKFLGKIFDNKVKVYYSGVLQDLDTPEGRMLANLMSSFNTYTIEKQSHLTKKALLDNVKMGKAHSVLAYGYTTNNDGFLQIDPEEAKIIKRIFNDHAKGKGCNSIAHELNEEGIPTRYKKLRNRDSKWADKIVRDICRNTIYYGKRKWGDEFYDAPAIITKELFDKNIEAFTTNQNTRGKKVDHKYLLNGIVKCAFCGRNMYGRRRISGKDNAYTCAGKRLKGDEKCQNRSINIDTLEAFMWQRFFVEQRFIELVEEAVRTNKEDDKHQEILQKLTEINSKFDSLKKEKKNAIQLAIKGLIDEEDIKPELKRIEDKIKELGIVKCKIDEQISFLTNVEIDQKTVEEEIKSLQTDAPFEVRRDIMERYISHIRVLGADPHHVVFVKFKLPIGEEIYIRRGKVYIWHGRGHGEEIELLLKRK